MRVLCLWGVVDEQAGTVQLRRGSVHMRPSQLVRSGAGGANGMGAAGGVEMSEAPPSSRGGGVGSSGFVVAGGGNNAPVPSISSPSIPDSSSEQFPQQPGDANPLDFASPSSTSSASTGAATPLRFARARSVGSADFGENITPMLRLTSHQALPHLRQMTLPQTSFDIKEAAIDEGNEEEEEAEEKDMDEEEEKGDDGGGAERVPGSARSASKNAAGGKATPPVSGRSRSRSKKDAQTRATENFEERMRKKIAARSKKQQKQPTDALTPSREGNGSFHLLFHSVLFVVVLCLAFIRNIICLLLPQTFSFFSAFSLMTFLVRMRDLCLGDAEAADRMILSMRRGSTGMLAGVNGRGRPRASSGSSGYGSDDFALPETK